ncbi:MAG: hypothetical protein BGO98_35235 [Myxococcales bacterium 68-20]|nr:hypothetical protein [Myxococcales bacterium]OJY25854.1 MAG: hypothetical protein BGO98_35235 [Myxococcales bacterium 68-20]
MHDEPKRLMDEDRGFARLVAATDTEAPSPGQFEKAMSFATAGRRNGWRWAAPRLLIGASVVAAVSLHFGGPRVEAPPTPPKDDVVSPDATASHATAPSASLRTVSVNDLAAPSDTVSPSNTPPTVPPPARARANTSPSARAANERGTTFGEELALVSTARSTLRARDLASCREAVENYQRRFPSGLFAQEIAVIRIEALAASGEREKANALAKDFLASNATSPYTQRVGSLLERTASGP